MKKSTKLQIKLENKIAIDTIAKNVDMIEDGENLYKILIREIENTGTYEFLKIKNLYVLVQEENSISGIVEYSALDHIDIVKVNDSEMMFIINGVKNEFTKNLRSSV